MKIDWSNARIRIPERFLKDETGIKDKLQDLVANNEAAIFIVEKLGTNEHDYRITVSSPLSDESVDNIERELKTTKIDWVLIEPEPVQHY